MQQVSQRLPARSIDVPPVLKEDLPRESAELLGSCLFGVGHVMCACVWLWAWFALNH